jgi:hypothetical protein
MSKYILEGKMVSAEAGWTDEGSGADTDIATAEAAIAAIPSGWYQVGPRAVLNYDTPIPQQQLVVRKHRDYSGEPIQPPARYVYTWGRSNSAIPPHNAMASFATEAPAGYIALTSLFWANGEPISTMLRQGCFIKDCLEETSLTGENWNDHGSGADDDGSIWLVNDEGGGLPWRLNLAVSGYDPPPGPFYKLNMDIVEMV